CVPRGTHDSGGHSLFHVERCSGGRPDIPDELRSGGQRTAAPSRRSPCFHVERRCWLRRREGARRRELGVGDSPSLPTTRPVTTSGIRIHRTALPSADRVGGGLPTPRPRTPR